MGQASRALPPQTVETAFAQVWEGNVAQIHPSLWTVDVDCPNTKQHMGGVQVGAPYLHRSGGAGWYVMPEIGSVCKVCKPGDSSAAFIMTFVTLGEAVQAGTDVPEDAPIDPDTGKPYPDSVVSRAPDGAYPSGRQGSQPGDMIWRGRDGNFVQMLRGGVLCLGSSEISQRIYIPLGNLIMDFCDRYEMHAAGGSIFWGMQETGGDHAATQNCQTFRLYADDKYADMRVSFGKPFNPIPIQAGDTDKEDVDGMQIGTDSDQPIVYEVAIAPGGFKALGELSSSAITNEVKLLYRFDRKGNVHIRAENYLVALRGRFKMKAKGDIEFQTDGNFIVDAKGAMVIKSAGTTQLDGKEVKLGAGTRGVAREGDPVTISLGPLKALLPPGAPAYLFGSIMTGSKGVKSG